jgi:predicted flap endonuclease-1-like 5' DNA nuclease
MKRVENLNAPSLNGWVAAVGAGIAAFLLSKVVGGFDYTTSGFFAAIVTTVVGLVLGMPWGAKDRIPQPEDDAAAHHPAVAPMAEAAAPNPVKTDSAPAPLMAAAPAAPAATPAPAAAAPAAAAPSAVASSAGGSKPTALTAPRGGKGDDLKTLEGVGPAMEKLCHELGIFHFDQIAAWGAAEVEWMDSNLKGFKGRVTRDRWVAQAKLIGEVGIEQFLIRAKTNDY